MTCETCLGWVVVSLDDYTVYARETTEERAATIADALAQTHGKSFLVKQHRLVEGSEVYVSEERCDGQIQDNH